MGIVWEPFGKENVIFFFTNTHNLVVPCFAFIKHLYFSIAIHTVSVTPCGVNNHILVSLQLFSSLQPGPLQCDFAAVPSRSGVYFFTWDLGWPCDLLWPTERSGNDTVPAAGLGFY